MRTAAQLGTALGLALILTACGGGGSGGIRAPDTSAIASFTKFSAISAGTPTRMEGASQELTYSWNGSTNKITSVGNVSAFSQTATADFTLDSAGNPTAIAFRSATGTNAAFSTSPSSGDTIGILAADPGTGVAVNSAGDKYALFARSTALGWDYQTFGIWVTGAGTGSGTAGSFSVGAATPGISIPAGGTATYFGSANGFYVDPTGTQYFTIATMSALTDFGNRTVNFTTSATRQSQTLIPGSFSANTSLDLSGTLHYAAGTNQISGTISSVGGGASNAPMSGSASARFFGPTAEEIGGGFAVRGSGTNGYLGSFGGKK